jgi:hypothetical protein
MDQQRKSEKWRRVEQYLRTAEICDRLWGENWLPFPVEWLVWPIGGPALFEQFTPATEDSH